jgi:excisionase family DNA binding protein
MSKDLTTRKVFTTGEVAEICNVAVKTVCKWCDSNWLPTTRLPGGGHRRINRKDLIEFCKSHDHSRDMKTALEKLTPTSKDDPLTIARNATSLLQEQGGEKYIGLLAGMMRTCCTKCGIHRTCEFAYDPYNVDCEPKIDCLAAK